MSIRLKRVATSISVSYGWGREVLRGIGEYLRQTRGWILFAEPITLTPKKLVSQLEAVDGTIIDTPDKDTIEELIRHRVPFVNLNTAMYARNVRAPCVGNDEAAIGEMAAEHLLATGVRHFAYCGLSNDVRNLRGESFAAKVQSRAISRISIRDDYHYEPSLLRRGARDSLAAWLQTLPKPVGVLAFNDLLARHVAEACLQAGLHVPQEVALIGVDNDGLVCELATPPLSSVDVGAFHQGYLAAKLLDRWMHGTPPGRVRHLIAPTRVAARQSTKLLSIANPNVSRAMAYIIENFNQGIGVDDVVKQVEISRRKLEYLFKAIMNSSPRQEIQRAKIRHARDLLGSSSLSVSEIAERCGFSRPAYFAETFLRETGESPAFFRKRVKYPELFS